MDPLVRGLVWESVFTGIEDVVRNLQSLGIGKEANPCIKQILDAQRRLKLIAMREAWLRGTAPLSDEELKENGHANQ